MTPEQRQAHFNAFFEDFFCEAAKFGNVEEVIVCENRNQHLTGNVYVRFETEIEAGLAHNNFNSRWYGGRPIYCELSPVTDFSEALCRNHALNQCYRGGFCNFIHAMKPSPNIIEALVLSQRKYRLQKAQYDDP